MVYELKGLEESLRKSLMKTKIKKEQKIRENPDYTTTIDKERRVVFLSITVDVEWLEG